MSRTSLIDLLKESDSPVPWLVPELLCQGQCVVLAGEPGAGKSFFAYALALALTSGLTILNRPTIATKVLYFDEENARPDLREYLRSIWYGLGPPPSLEMADANFLHEHFSLAQAGPLWGDYMAKVAREFQPGLIVVDTTTPACHIEDENSNAEASIAIRKLRHARASAGPACTLLLIKHARLNTVNGEWKMRGASTWKGETDGTLIHQIGPGRPRNDGLRNTVIHPDKVRAFGLRVPIRLQPSYVGKGATKGITLVAVPEKAEGRPPEKPSGQ